MIILPEKKIWTPNNSFLLEYRAKAETGEIVIGQDLWRELDNLSEDMLDDRYIYDTGDAIECIDFMQQCVRLTQSPFYNQPMVLMLWQKALIEAFYSFKMARPSKELGMWIDRFKKLLLLIARKNGKSETCSGLSLSEFILGNEGGSICCSSNDDTQARIVYDAIDTMRMLIDPKDQDTKRNQQYILNRVSNTKIFKMSDRTRNKEGRNIDFAIVDESHEMKENTIGKPIEQSQSLKDNPKFINITTEGFIRDGYLDQELKKGYAVINQEEDGAAAERLLPWFYTQDSEQEVWNGNRKNRLWEKSNPSLGTVKKWEYLEEQVDEAKKSKVDRIYVLSKDFNLKQNSAQSWLNLEDYDYQAVYDLEDFRGSICLGAVDLSETTDLTCAKILMMRQGDKTKYIHTKYFIPESKIENNADWDAGARYSEWTGAGLMKVSEGNDIDLSIVADWFYSLYTDYDIKLWKCGYDQRFSKDWINRMEFYGWQKGNEDLILILQNAETLNNAMKLLEADLTHQLVNYNENPVDRWCFKNACVEVNSKGQGLCVKAESAKRIDGAVTNIILYEMYRRYRTEFREIIERKVA